ncbi:MAG: M20/M25/M40 family metallo-hydrolase [Solirubrobacteraceae bacterium]|nr:M20/M25/M40 family metallo-hydrolase [Solirubrobacteraceae bacterium]
MPAAWIEKHAERLAARAERDVEALVAVSSPSGDAAAAEEVVAVAAALAPAEADLERIECSSSGHAPDLLVRLAGPGARRILLLGHLDTVVAHGAHVPARRAGALLYGSGTLDMKGGVAIALGLMHALRDRPEVGEVALLLVNDEEWRTVPFAHASRFAGFDACLCFEAGERDARGREAVVVRRKAAGAIRVTAHGRAAHSGAAPDAGVSALLALADVARLVAGLSDPGGADRLTAVPTILRSGESLNVVPAAGELVCDVRADSVEVLRRVRAAIPERIGKARIEAVLEREWPGMDARSAVAPILDHAGEALGRPVVAADRGGASDASHFATVIEATIDGLGPIGEHSHHPDEHIDLGTLAARSEVALAVADAVLRRGFP